METAIYDLLVNSIKKGRVVLSVPIGSLLVLNIFYPDDQYMTIADRNPRNLVRQLQEVMREKFGNDDVVLMPASPEEAQEQERLFRERKDEVSEILENLRQERERRRSA